MRIQIMPTIRKANRIRKKSPKKFKLNKDIEYREFERRLS